MERGKLLGRLQLGSSVAEYDDQLERYFVETQAFKSLISGAIDTVAGDKGTGKSALFRTLCSNARKYDELAKVEVIAAVNPTGSPVFQRLAAESANMTEGQYITVWKAYVVSLIGNFLLQIFEGDFGKNMTALDEMLTRTGLKSADDSPSTVFNSIVNLVRRLANPKAFETSVTLTDHGFPVIVPRVEFGPSSGPAAEPTYIPHDEALALLNRVLEEADVTVWLAMDRLDEAFQGSPDVETPALRALLRTHLDLIAFNRLRMKLFLRKDLFRRIIGDRFVNLTHINARKMEIVWDEEDLFHLLDRRMAENIDFVSEIKPPGSRASLFDLVFPPKVDAAERKPTTPNWMMSRIKDGNQIKPPRNLIDLVTKARDAQIRREERETTPHEQNDPLIESDSLKRGLAALSKERVEDTLLAEAGELAPVIEHFRDGKAEHNTESLQTIVGDGAEGDRQIKALIDIGFLEVTGDSYKVPILYRQGLNITQGKAFALAEGVAPDDEPADE